MSDPQRAMVPKIVPDDGPGRELFIQAVSDHIMPRQKDFAWGEPDLRLFLLKCDVLGLNPFKNQIYAVPFDGKLQFVVSIDGWRAQAARTGEYRGSTEPQWCGPDGEWKDVWLEEGAPAAARIGVRRLGWETVYAVARYNSYVRKNREGRPIRNWAEMPDVMIAKCAEALAFRRAFPDEMAGLDLEDVGAMDAEARRIDRETGELPMTEQERAEAAPEPESVEVAKGNAAPVAEGTIGPEGASTLLARTKALGVPLEDFGAEVARRFGSETILAELTGAQSRELWDWVRDTSRAQELA